MTSLLVGDNFFSQLLKTKDTFYNSLVWSVKPNWSLSVLYFIAKSDIEVDHSTPDCSLFKERTGNNHYVFLPVLSKYIVLSCRTEVKRQWKQAIEGKPPNFANAYSKIIKSFENMQ